MSWRFCAIDGDLSVDVPEGQTTIGRGSLLQIADKHVSRSHAMVELTDGKCRLLPTHTNPCFHKARDADAFSALQQDVWQDLSEGDVIGLAPTQHRFRLEKGDSSQEKRPTATEEPTGSMEPTVEENQTDETNSATGKRELEGAEDGCPAKKPRVEVEKIDASDEGLVPVLASTAVQGSFTASGQEQNKTDQPEKEAKPRPPCQYGASCYRKNPIHFQEFSHPGDSDYITPAVLPQPPKQQTPQKQQPQKQKGGQPKTESGRPMRKAAERRVKTSVLAGDSDEDEESFDENDTFNDEEEFLESSESEEDAGGRESDDEWMPEDGDDDDDVKDLVIEADDYVPGGRRSRPRAKRY